jgi:hypothetical protein
MTNFEQAQVAFRQYLAAAVVAPWIAAWSDEYGKKDATGWFTGPVLLQRLGGMAGVW